MRHGIAGYKLSRDAEDLRALRRNLAVALFTHGQITTTLPKAKMVQPLIEKIITKARRGDLASRRQVISAIGHDRIMVKNDTDESVQRNRYGELVGGPKVVKKIFDDIAPQYRDRPGGYTRIVKLGKHRIGDGTDLVVLQLVDPKDFRQKPGTDSRRRQTADKRTAFAAKVRKAKAEGADKSEKAEAKTETAAEST
jgi:large subunit ribosomal protein L17